ncbi:MFS transporter, partial [Candidatus Zixiibacteriota bacterium]
MNPITNKLPKNILLLGLVSFLADTSTHMIKPILPMFIAALGGGGLAVGVIGGLTESIASLLKVFSGYWSDRIKRRKPFLFMGYLTSAIVKLLFPLATVWQHILVLMPMERVGKGLRGAPRDALIAASAKREVRGRGFGLHRAMDTAGAVLGSLLAFALVFALTTSLRTVLFIAALVAFSSVLPLLAVKERRSEGQSLIIQRPSLRNLPGPYYRFLAAATVFSLGNFTYMFLILRAGLSPHAGLNAALPLLLYALINVVYAALSLPSGILSDRIGRKKV